MIKELFARIYAIYVLFMFSISFLVMYPFFLMAIYIPGWIRLSNIVNKIWSKIYFVLILLPSKRIIHPSIDRKKGQYVYCGNHFSYMDIPLLALTPNWYVFIGKSSISKVPLFGGMYKKVHITVDRSSKSSRWESVIKAKEAVDMGKSPVFFPEGGIRSENPPQMKPFKDGAFKVAIEKQISIVPVTIPYDWVLLRAAELKIFWKKQYVIYHEPIETKDLTLKDLEELKQKTYNVIQETLNEYNKIS